MKEYNIELILKYINGEDVEGAEDDYKFMISVIKYTKDKNMYELCSDNVKSTYEFVLFMIEEFKCDIEFLIDVVDYYLDNEREEVKRIEILIIMCDTFKDSNYIKEYSSLLANIYATIKFNIEAIKKQPTMEFETIKEVIQEGFNFILENYNSSNIVMNYFAEKFIIDIVVEHNINLEEMLHNDFKTYDQLEKYGKIRYLIKLLNKYDTNLVDYIICHKELLNDIKTELDRIKNNWNLYSSFDNKSNTSSKVLKFAPKKNKSDA